MDNLLTSAIEAHGGLNAWNKLQSLHANVSIGGALWELKQLPGLFKIYGGTLILNVGINAQHGAHLIAEGAGDLIAFGKDYIANPDLAERIRLDARLNELRPEYFYGRSAAGYTDYPTLPQSRLIQETTNVK